MQNMRQPQQLRSAETRRRILREARRQFASCGFESANVRDIAKAAETTHSMIRYHFGTKERLWKEAVREMFAFLNSEVAEPPELAELSGIERLKGFVSRYVRYCAKHPEHAWITIQETINGGDRLEWMVEQFVKVGHQESISFLQSLVDDGTLPQCDIVNIIYTMVGMVQLPFVLAKEAKASFGVDMFSEEQIERQSKLIIELLTR